MKLIKVMSEGYSGISDIFPVGEHFYCLDDNEADDFVEKFEAWRDGLGDCKDQTYGGTHPASTHVWLTELEIEEVPDLPEVTP